MHHAIRKTAVATATMLITGLLGPLTASPAEAVTQTETQFYAVDKDGDGTSGLYRRDTATGTEHAVLADTGAYDVDMLSGTRNGDRFVARLTIFDSAGNPARRRIVVFDVSGRARVIQDVAVSGASVITPALSPDGSTVVWTYINKTTNAVSLLRAPFAGGSATVIGSNVANAVFADASTLIVESAAGPWYSMPAVGGTKTAITAIPDTASQAAVSADGTHIAWSKDTTTASSTAVTADVQDATLAVPSTGVATVGTPVTVASNLYDSAPSFSRDGTSVYYVQDDGKGGVGTLRSAPADGSTPLGTAVTPAPAGDVYEQAIGTADDGAPGAVTAGAAWLNGTLATLHWSLPSDADLSGVIINRYLGSTLQKSFYVPAPLRAVTDTGLVLNQTYRYDYRAVDRSGNVGTIVSRYLTALRPTPTFADPTSAGTTRAPFAVTFESGVPSNVRFVVDYHANGSSTWYHWVTGAAGGRRTYGAPATTNVLATTAYPGYTYQFRVTARDGYGNTSYAVLSGRAVVPFDQTKGSFSSGAKISVSTAWYGSYRVLRLAGSYVRVSVTGDRFQLIGFRCTTCGVFDVYEGSTRVATVDSRATRTVARTVLYTRSWSKVGTRTLTIRARGTAGRPNVIVDGFGIRR